MSTGKEVLVYIRPGTSNRSEAILSTSLKDKLICSATLPYATNTLLHSRNKSIPFGEETPKCNL